MPAHRSEILLYTVPLLATLVTAGDIATARLTFLVTMTLALVAYGVIRYRERASWGTSPTRRLRMPPGRTVAEAARSVPVLEADADAAHVDRALRSAATVLLRRDERYRFLTLGDPLWRDLAPRPDVTPWQIARAAPIIDGAWEVAAIDERTLPPVAVVALRGEILGVWSPHEDDPASEPPAAPQRQPRTTSLADRPTGDLR